MDGDENLADALEALIHRQGGIASAHLIFAVAPELRRRLGDRKLVRFLHEWPERFEIVFPSHAQGTTAPKGGLIEIRALRSASSVQCNTVPSDASQSRVVHAARLLADSIWAALWKHAAKMKTTSGQGEHGERHARQALAAHDEYVAEKHHWVPLPWLVRDKVVKQRLQGFLLLSPSRDLLYRHDPAFTEILGSSGAWWATLAGHMHEFISEWPLVGTMPPRPVLRENCLLSCDVEASGNSKALERIGYRCPCRFEVGGHLHDNGRSCNGDAHRADTEARRSSAAVLQRVIRLLDCQDVPLQRLAMDAGVQRLLRQLQPDLRNTGFASWLRSQSALVQRVGESGEIWVSKASTVGDGGSDHRTKAGINAATSGKARSSRGSHFKHKRLCEDSDDGEGAASSDSGADGEAARALENLQILKAAPGVIAVFKPAGVTTEATLARLRAKLSEEGPDAVIISVSRLDRMTSGVLVAAHGGLEAAEFLKAQFSGRMVYKEYHCLCKGAALGPEGSTGEVKQRLKLGKGQYRAFISPQGKEAHTEYKVLAEYPVPQTVPDTSQGPCCEDELCVALRQFCSRSVAVPGSHLSQEILTLIQAHPLTGRTHQIRAHMTHIGRPLVADMKYSPRRARQDLAWCPRLFLHCASMRLRALDGTEFAVHAPLPPDLTTALGALQVDQHFLKSSCSRTC